MKYTIKQITEGENEVILKYRNRTPEVERILSFLNGEQPKLLGFQNQTATILEPDDILYIETVDGKTFAYTKEEVLQLDCTLSRCQQILCDINFFRCSKSMILNIDKVRSLCSLPSNRIDATICNGEHIIISRTYASDFRKRIKGGGTHEEA